MQNLFAVLQSDPTLLGCQLDRLRSAVDLGPDPASALGMGYYATGDVLVRKKPNVRSPTVATLAQGIESNAVVLFARGPGGPAFDDETTPPYRFRRWLWAEAGEVEGFAAYRGALLARLPEFLRRSARSDHEVETFFMCFAAQLRDQGRLDDLDLDAESAATALGRAARLVEEQAAAAGQKRPALAVAATNGRVLVALRRGQPLWYALLEGIVPCAVHGIDASTPDHDPRARPHHKVRAVALATRVVSPSGWVEVPEGSTVGVGRGLQVAVASL